MSATTIVVLVIAAVVAVFLAWAWAMNRWDEREHRRMVEELREPPVLGNPPPPGRTWRPWT